jgi:hypothetical protein
MIQILELDKGFAAAIITMLLEVNTLEVNLKINTLNREIRATKKRIKWKFQD